MGWNHGRNPLPFVLVEDVADAIARATLKPELSGRSLNLVGDVAMTAREYIDELAGRSDAHSDSTVSWPKSYI